MKKRILTVLLAVCLVVALGTVTAMADRTSLPEPVNEVIKLEENITLSSATAVPGNVTLDLNGFTIDCGTSGRLDISTNVIITDSSESGNGQIISNSGNTVVIGKDGNLTVNAGKIENKNYTTNGKGGTAIYNMGTLTISGGEVAGETAVYNTSYNNGLVDGKIVCNITGGTVNASIWGVAAMGPGFDSEGNVDCEKVTVNISGGTIKSGGQGFCTNASSGQRAGYTLNMTGGTIDAGSDGTGMYLPAIGVNNISGGNITGAQGIRICAGELNITGGTITGTAVGNEEDLIAGGSGGTSGALVIGKASGGYVGDIIVNISGDADIRNTATGEGTKPVIVISDKNMAQDENQTIKLPDGTWSTDQSFNYSEQHISVNVEDVELVGDIVRISNISHANTKDGGDTSITIDSAIVTGDVINQSKNGGMTVNDSVVKGAVTVSGGNGTIAVLNSSVASKIGSGIILVNTSVGGSEPTTDVVGNVAIVDGVGYTTLEAAIAAADDGDTITLVGNVTANDTVTIPNDKALTIVGNGHSIVINHDINSAEHEKALIIYSPLTLDGVELTINGYTASGAHFGDGIQVGADTSDDATLTITNKSKVTLNGVSNAMVMPGGANAKVTVENSEFTLNGIGGNGSNGGTYVFNNADVNVNGCASYGFSVYSMTTSGNTTIDISNTAYSAIYGHSTLDFVGNTVVNVSNCGPKEVGSGGIQYGYRDAPIQLRRGPAGAESITIGENATVNITNCTDQNGNSINNIYVVAGTTYTNNGTVNANIVMEAAPTGWNTVKVINNGVTIYSGYVADNGSFKLPTLSRNGYTFGGWRVNNSSTVVKGGTSYTVTTDTTFTAIWNAINIPDTYDIELIVGEGGEAKASYSNASAGTTITITVAPDEGYELDYITVDGERISGTTFKMPDHDVTVRVYFTDGSAVLPFTDVSANQWFYEAVSYVYTNGMMEGDSATTFNPDGQMTRAMFWAVLGRIDGATITGANWVETARSWAMAEGVSDGTNPNDYVTREMMVTMLWRYAGEPASEESLSGYSDAANVSDWAAEAMSWALETGVIEGVTATTLQPQGTATRAQCATIFMRYDMI